MSSYLIYTHIPVPDLSAMYSSQEVGGDRYQGHQNRQMNDGLVSLSTFGNND